MTGVRRWRLLADEDDAERELSRPLAEERLPALAWPWAAAILAVAALPRLLYIFFAGQPENAAVGMYGDVYHHWQIAYLTQQIGLSHGPRLWDLKGLDYFWGILHPILLVAVFTLTGSTSIVLVRLLGAAFGCAVVLLVFLLCRRHWGLQVAIAAGAFAAFAPTSVFNDASGMVEPIGVALCLLGIWLLPRRAFLAGIVWGLATMARAEAWVFTAGLVVATVLHPATRRQSLTVAIGWGGVLIAYMKLLLDQTGNPVYPLYWNLMADAFGRWEAPVGITPEQWMVRLALGLFLVAPAAGLVFTLVRRPRGYLLLTFGLGYWVLVAVMLGFTAYLRSWVDWMWITRLFVFPYEFAAILGAVGLFRLLPRWPGRASLAPAAGTAGAALLAVQAAWLPIQAMYSDTFATWATTVNVGERAGAVYGRPGIAGGAFAVPADRPNLTYALAQYGHVPGAHLLSEFYDPFYYLPRGTTYTGNRAYVGIVLQCWLARTNVTLIAVDSTNGNYSPFVADHPAWFAYAGSFPEEGFALYQVRVPKISVGACEDAERALRSA